MPCLSRLKLLLGKTAAAENDQHHMIIVDVARELSLGQTERRSRLCEPIDGLTRVNLVSGIPNISVDGVRPTSP